MTMPSLKPLKELDTAHISEDSDAYYIHNKDKNTSIEVPKKVYKTIQQIQTLPNGINHIFVDVLATAINKRRLEDVSDALETWKNDSFKLYYIPMCSANQSFDKLIRTFHTQICPTHLTETQVRDLIYFFAKCPHGYNVTNLLMAHAEMNPVIT